jgi:hypothetical protein
MIDNNLVGTAYEMSRPVFDDLIAKAKEMGAIVGCTTVSGKISWYAKSPYSGIVSPRDRDSEDQAWAILIERMCLSNPGTLILTSCEFGEVFQSNALGQDGRLGTRNSRHRLEIRLIRGKYQVLDVERTYPPANEPARDTAQHRIHYHGIPETFEALGAAATYVDAYLKDFMQCESDFINDAR